MSVTAKQIPPEVVRAFKESSGTFYQRIAAALNAWEGMLYSRGDATHRDVIHLPLTQQESGDA